MITITPQPATSTPVPARPTDRKAAAQPISDREIDRVAWRLEREGILPYENEVAAVVARARTTGVSPVLVEVLGDLTEPEVARIRAFGLVALRLAAAA
jgi:hypothetical protein